MRTSQLGDACVAFGTGSGFARLWRLRASARTLFACAMLTLMAFCLAACASSPQVPERAAVNDYSWAELSALSDEIASAADDGAAIQIAKRYHLVDDQGKLDGSQRKQVQLANGVNTEVVVVGFRHDEVPGGAKAGITFMFADAVAKRAMNNNAGFDERSESDGYDAEGGWLASEARAWLNGEFADLLPSDMRASLKSVSKRSIAIPEYLIASVNDNGSAEFSEDALLSAGVDKLWLACASEVADPQEDQEAADERPEWTPVLQREGERYQLFADAQDSGTAAAARVRAIAGTQAGKPCRWWLRSVEDMTFCDVRQDGSLDRMQDELAAHALGIVPCFAV